MTAQTLIHETSIIDDGERIGTGTRIWHWVHVCSGARIGEKCSMGQNVFVGNKVGIGNNVKIQNSVSVFDNVTLKDDVFCGPSMVFTNVYNPTPLFPAKRNIARPWCEKAQPWGPTAPLSALQPSASTPL